MKTHSEPPSNRNFSRLLLSCIGVHLAIDFALIGQAWFSADYQLLIGVALPLCQCSLAAIWAVSSRGNLALRFVVPPATAVFCWYVLSKMLVWGIGDPAAVAWALTLVVQMLAILVAYHFYQVAWFLTSRSDADQNRADITFNLRTLMLWSTIIACAFGLIQFGREHWQWDTTVADWEYIYSMPVIGLFNAQLALLCFWALAKGSWLWRSAKIVMAVVAIGLSGYLLPRLLDLTTSSHALEVRESMVLAAAQGIVVFGTLAVALVAISLRNPNLAPAVAN